MKSDTLSKSTFVTLFKSISSPFIVSNKTNISLELFKLFIHFSIDFKATYENN